MKRNDQKCVVTTSVSCNLEHFNSTPTSFLPKFADFQSDSMSRMSTLSNASFSPRLLPTMFSPDTTQALASICNNSLLHIEMDGFPRPILESHEPFLLQDHIHTLSGQSSAFREETLPSLAAALNHPPFAASEIKCDFSSSSFSCQQQNNLPSTGKKPRSTNVLVNKDGNHFTTSSRLMNDCPVALNHTLSRDRSSPASLFSGLATEALSINTRHTALDDSSLSTQLLSFENDNDVVGFSEPGLTSLSEVTELSAEGVHEDLVTNEGSLMTILDAPRLLNRPCPRDAVEMNVSSPSDLQEGTADQSTFLVRHLSLPVPLSSKEVPAGDDSLPDSVPCRLRAKRGCATHPRSIAERNRRTRISERMRNLQELIPNMDKQSNTVDMLDEAIEYVKFLQRQIQELSESRAACERLCKLKPNEGRPS